MKRYLISILLLVIFPYTCKSPSSPESLTDKPIVNSSMAAWRIFDMVKTYTFGYTQFYLQLEGKIRNVGNCAGYNVSIDWKLYKTETEPWGTMWVYIANGINIKVNEAASWDCLCWDARIPDLKWDYIYKLEYKISWTDRCTGIKLTEKGFINNF